MRLHGKPLLIIERSDDHRAPDTAGWWLWDIGPHGHGDPGPDGQWPQPLEAPLDAEREHVEHAAATAIAHQVASDQIHAASPAARTQIDQRHDSD